MAKTIRVRMKVSIAGHAEPLYDLADFSFVPEQVVELHATLADAWLAAGHAVRVDKKEPLTSGPELTALQTDETAAMEYDPTFARVRNRL